MNIILPLEIVANMPWIWLGLMVLFLILEGLTMGLTTIWMAIAALITMFCAFIIPSAVVQLFIFLILTIVLLLFTRPFAVKKLKLGSVKTNSDRFIGMEAMVLAPISDLSPGQVKVGGQVWTAKPAIHGLSLEANELCIIERIEGVSLYVNKLITESQENL